MSQEVQRVKSGARWWWVYALAILAFFAAALLFASPMFRQDKSAANMGQSCNFASEQVDVSSDTVSFKPACFVDLKQMTPEQKKMVVVTGLQNSAVLGAWELCEAEIRAAIDAQARLADTYANFSRPQVNVYDIAALERAAVLAWEASIPCASGASDKLHKARVTVVIDGTKHDAVVSDYDVMSGTTVQWPVEYFKLTGQCPASLKAKSEQIAKLPDNFDRTIALTALDVQTHMLTAAGITC